MHVRQINK